MNNVFVYCEIEGTTVAEVSQELLTKGRKLANELGVQLHAVVAGTGIKGKVEDRSFPMAWTSSSSSTARIFSRILPPRIPTSS